MSFGVFSINIGYKLHVSGVNIQLAASYQQSNAYVRPVGITAILLQR